MRARNLVGAGAAVLSTVAVVLTSVAPADAIEADPLDVVRAVAPGTVAAAASVSTTGTGVNAINSTAGTTAVTVPVDPAAGITLGIGERAMSIGLPFARGADHAIVEQPGVVSFDNNNGSTTVPVVQRDGTVLINTVISAATAPQRYDYPIRVPEGHSLRLLASGAAIVGDDAGGLSAVIAAPWAKDSLGNPVPTHYEVQGDTLTQVVDFTPSTAFPVVADPAVTWLLWGRTVKYSKAETQEVVRFTDSAQMFSYLCIVGGLAGAACTTVANLGLQIVKNAAQNALRAGRCIQLNIPYVGLGLVYDVKC